MKKVFVYLSFILFNSTCIGQINFVDQNFKNKLLEADALINNIATDTDGNPITIDINNNNEIETSEALNVYRLFIPYCNINNLVGIENFTNLIFINCAHNNLINIDLLNQLNNLQEIGCDYNYLTAFNLNNLIHLKYLFCNNNQLSNIDFSNNPTLQKVYCGNNQITSLNFSNNPLFNDLGCKNNPNLASINISNGTTQLFGPTTWLNECWTGCPNLTRICADSSEMNTLQTYLSNCGVDTFVIDFTSNCNLGNEAFAKNEMVIYPNPFKNSFKISVPNLTSDNVIIKVYDMLGKTIEILDLSTQQLETLELGKNYKSGVYSILVQQGTNLQTLRIIKE